MNMLEKIMLYLELASNITSAGVEKGECFGQSTEDNDDWPSAWRIQIGGTFQV